MKIDLLEEDWENLSTLRSKDGFRVLLQIREIMARTLGLQALAAANRPDRSISEQVAELGGMLKGIDFVINQIQDAQRNAAKEHKNNKKDK